MFLRRSIVEFLLSWGPSEGFFGVYSRVPFSSVHDRMATVQGSGSRIYGWGLRV